ncbi:MAG TPA: hydrophobic protein [Candidatus Dormibacteraeota bacterium]
MVALIALLLILAIFGGLGFAVHVLWWILIIALILWALGFLMRGSGGGRWYNW